LTPQVIFYAATWAIALVFQAGANWFAFKLTRRDVNGLGAKMRRIVAEFVLQADTPEKRERAARMVEGK
jgi:hypothetical protein